MAIDVCQSVGRDGGGFCRRDEEARSPRGKIGTRVKKRGRKMARACFAAARSIARADLSPSRRVRATPYGYVPFRPDVSILELLSFDIITFLLQRSSFIAVIPCLL